MKLIVEIEVPKESIKELKDDIVTAMGIYMSCTNEYGIQCRQNQEDCDTECEDCWFDVIKLKEEE